MKFMWQTITIHQKLPTDDNEIEGIIGRRPGYVNFT